MTLDEALEMAAKAAEETFADGAERAARIRAMKSDAPKPPEKSPEVDVATWEQRVGSLTFDLATTRAERDALKAQLEAQNRHADEALARIKHMEWVMAGSLMQGEAESDDGPPKGPTP